MAIEIANVVQALFGIRSDASTGVQYLGGAGVIKSSLARSAAGTYTIDLEQPLSKDVSAFPAVGKVNYTVVPNVELGLHWNVNAEVIDGAVVGRKDRIKLYVTNAGVATDPAATVPITVAVFAYPSQEA